MTARVRTGVGLFGDMPMAELVRTAREIEEMGYDDLWFGDERFYRDVYVCLSHIAHATERIGLGVSVTNPYTRHPALTAVAAASVDELSGHRLKLGIGAGGSNHGPLGISRPRPRTAIKEMTEVVRRLWRGEEVDFHGKVIELNSGRLDFTPEHADIPIYVAARGPETLKLAGQIADGAIIGALSSEAGIRYARRQIAAGAALAGRDADEVDVVAWIYTSISDDAAAARAAVARLVVNSLQNSRDILAEIGLELPDDLRAFFERTLWSQAIDVVDEAAKLLPQHIVDQLSLTGTVREVAQKIERIALSGVREIAVLPFAPAGGSRMEVVRRFQREVVPALNAG